MRLLVVTLLAFCVSSAATPPRVVFVCDHGSAKSVVAAAHFNRMAAERGLRHRAVARGATPDPKLAPAAVNGLAADDLVPVDPTPRKLERADVEGARVIAFGELPEQFDGVAAERWDVPPVSKGYAASRDAMVVLMQKLIDSLAAESGRE